MGAWGYQFDENDDAADWLAEFEDAPDWGNVRSALMLVTTADYVEAPDASSALAAAEVVGAGLGRRSARLPEAVADWAAAYASGASVARDLALQALSRVRDDSELAELWGESGEATEWRASLDELATRLN